MNETRKPLDRIDVESPCTQSWDAMTGDDKRRFCGECRLHVHNLSAMTTGEADDLLATAEGRVCVRFFRRPDGTVMTKDCVPARERVRRRLRRIRVAAAALFGFLGPLGLGACSASDQELPPLGGTDPSVQIEPEALMGEPTMGDVCVPEELTPSVEPEEPAPGSDAPDADPEDDSDESARIPEERDNTEILGRVAFPPDR